MAQTRASPALTGETGSWLAMACVFAIGVAYLATLRPGHDWGDDFSMYIHHAANLVNGRPYAETGYIYNPHNPSVGPRMYPPGFPLLLTPVISAFGMDLTAMKVVEVLCFAAALAMAVVLFRPRLTGPSRAALVLLVGLNPWFWDFKDQVLSDLPFLLLILVSLTIFSLADDQRDPRMSTLLAVLAGLSAYAAYATRTLGIVLIASFLLSDAARHKVIRLSTMMAALVFAGFAAAQFRWGINDHSYLDQLTGSTSQFSEHAIMSLQSLSALWDNGYSGAVRKGLSIVAGGLAIYGYAGSLGKHISVREVFPACYVAAVLVWPSFQGMRLLVPLVPFLLYYTLLGAQHVDAAQSRRAGVAHVALIFVLGASLVSYAGRYATLDAVSNAGIGQPQSDALFAFVVDSTPPDDVFVFDKPRALSLFTGRRAAAPFAPANACDLWRYMDEIHATYAITRRDPASTDAEYLQRFVARFRNDFHEVMRSRELAVYRIEGQPCRGGELISATPY